MKKCFLNGHLHYDFRAALDINGKVHKIQTYENPVHTSSSTMTRGQRDSKEPICGNVASKWKPFQLKVIVLPAFFLLALIVATALVGKVILLEMIVNYRMDMVGK